MRFGSYAKVSERGNPSSPHPLFPRMREPIFTPSVVPAYAGTHLHPIRCPRVCGDPSSPTPSVTSTPVGASLVGARPVLPTHPPSVLLTNAGSHLHPIPCPRVCGDPSSPPPLSSRMRGPIFPYPLGHLHPRRGVPCGRPSCVAHTSPFRSPHERGIPSSSPPLSSRMRGPIFVPSVVLAYAGTHLRPLSCPRVCGDPSSSHPLSSRMQEPIFTPSVVLAYAGTHIRPIRCPRECGNPFSPPLLSSRMREPIFAPSLVLAKAGTHLRPLSCPRVCGDPSSPHPLSSRMREPIFTPSLVLAYAGTHLPLPPQSPPPP